MIAKHAKLSPFPTLDVGHESRHTNHGNRIAKITVIH